LAIPSQYEYFYEEPLSIKTSVPLSSLVDKPLIFSLGEFLSFNETFRRFTSDTKVSSLVIKLRNFDCNHAFSLLLSAKHTSHCFATKFNAEEKDFSYGVTSPSIYTPLSDPSATHVTRHWLHYAPYDLSLLNMKECKDKCIIPRSLESIVLLSHLKGIEKDGDADYEKLTQKEWAKVKSMTESILKPVNLSTVCIKIEPFAHGSWIEMFESTVTKKSEIYLRCEKNIHGGQHSIFERFSTAMSFENDTRLKPVAIAMESNAQPAECLNITMELSLSFRVFNE
jgi:hypothetical protein